MTRSFPSRPDSRLQRSRVPWRVSSTLLIALGAAACESPVAPAACGPLSAVTVNVGETSSVAACFNDANNDVLTYTASSSNPAIATASIAGTSITVAGVAPGNTTVTVTASDPEGLQGQSNFAVTVPNRAPQTRGTMPNVTVPVERTATVQASQYFLEPDGEALTYTASSSDGDVASVSVAGSTVTVTGRATGRATITITASDPGGLSANQSFRLTVPNRPPAAVGAIGAQTIELGGSVTIDVARSFSDPDGDALTYSATSSNSSVARSSVSGSTVTITGASAGRATITVTARDPGGLSATQRISVTVGGSGGADLVVSLSKSSVTVAPGGSVTYEVTIRNQGDARSAATRARLFQSADPTITTSDRELDSYSIRSLAPSEEVRATNRITIPAGASDGSKFYVGDCVDAVSGESNTNNNCSSALTITVRTGGGSGGADLVVTVSRSSVTVAPGGSFSYDMTVRNQGDAVAAATQLRTFASMDATISTNDTQIGEANSVSSLGPSQEVSGTQTITVSEGTPETFYIGECVDAVSRRVEHEQQLLFGDQGLRTDGRRWRERHDVHDGADDRDAADRLLGSGGWRWRV